MEFIVQLQLPIENAQSPVDAVRKAIEYLANPKDNNIKNNIYQVVWPDGTTLDVDGYTLRPDYRTQSN